MKHPLDQDIILENDRALLRPLTGEDKKHLLPFSMNEPELWKYSITPGDGEENLDRYIELALEGRINKIQYPFIVYDKKFSEWAGSTRFYDFQLFHNTVQLGYTWYGSKYHGTGLNKHCKYLMLSYAFDIMGLDRVEFRADNNNARSIAAMKSLGCTVEGVLRSNCQGVEGRRDSIILSILKNEWKGGIKDNLEKRLIWD